MKYIITSWILLFFISCNNRKPVIKVDKNVFYTCSMHPQVIRDQPGKCAICGMQLIAVNKTTNDSLNVIKLSDEQIRLGNIILDTLKNGNIGSDVVLPATLNIDQTKTSSISSRITGRIEKLYYKNVGEYIPAGAHLFDIYSEQLNSAKQEYLMALERKKSFDNSIINFSELLASARRKLKLWGISDGEINAIGSSGKFSTLTPFYNSQGGYITSFTVTEGEYVAEGSLILTLVQLSTLWAEAQVYSSQLPSIKMGSLAKVAITDFPGNTITGKIDFQNPETSSGSRINLIRIMIPNKDNLLKPGMAASVTILSGRQYGLLLPVDAVLRDNKGASVWIKTGPNTFRNLMVTTGIESDDRIEIKSGLQPGEVIVVGGAYLLNSEYIFKKGANPMEGMKM